MGKINIIYLHGFGSNGSSSKGDILKSAFGNEFNIITPTLSVNPKKAIQEITNLVSNKGTYILVGTSLGGFYADYFNKIADIPCVLINPVINIEQLQRHIGINKNYNTGENYEYSRSDYNDLVSLKNRKDSYGYSDSPEYIVSAKDDELCDYRLAQKTFTNDNQWLQVVASGGHRFTDTGTFINTVKELIKDLDGYDFSNLHNGLYESKKNVLNEKFINLFNQSEKELFYTEVEKLIIDTYGYIGGMKGNILDFMNDNHFWKLIRKNGKIVAGKIYKDKLGRKSVCAFTDGTHLGKVCLKIIVMEDMKYGRAWAEVSGKMENIYKYSIKATPLPHEIVKVVMDAMGKEVLDWDPDGYHYTRIIKGEPLTKAMYGNHT